MSIRRNPKSIILGKLILFVGGEPDSSNSGIDTARTKEPNVPLKKNLRSFFAGIADEQVIRSVSENPGGILRDHPGGDRAVTPSGVDAGQPVATDH